MSTNRTVAQSERAVGDEYAPTFSKTRRQGKKVAVMYRILPDAGYFRLFEAVDEFVIFDCVQFPRRGRVHRSEVPGMAGRCEWLTLPLARQAWSIEIRAIGVPGGCPSSLRRKARAVDGIATSCGPAADDMRAYLSEPLDSA